MLPVQGIFLVVVEDFLPQAKYVAGGLDVFHEMEGSFTRADKPGRAHEDDFPRGCVDL
jgi:hypothetical protein